MSANCSNPDCGENTLVAELEGNGRVTRRCCVCGLSQAIAQAPTTTQAPRHSPINGGQPVVTSRPARKRSFLAEAKAELAGLRRQIKDLEKLKRQADELERLIRAAKQKPESGAVVRPLRKQG